jgi:hypothetical protein
MLAGGVVATTFLILRLFKDENIDLGPAQYYKGKEKGQKFDFK